MCVVSCSYVPLEIPIALGVPARRAFFGDPGSACSCQAYLPRDFCPYARAFTRRYAPGSAVVVAGSCDGMRRAYDALLEYGLAEAVHFVDVPRSSGDGADVYYADVLRRLASELASVSSPSAVNWSRAGPTRGRGSRGHRADVAGRRFALRLAAVTKVMDSLRRGLRHVFELSGEGRLSAVTAVEAALAVNEAFGGGAARSGWMREGAGREGECRSGEQGPEQAGPAERHRDAGGGTGPAGDHDPHSGWFRDAVRDAWAAIRRATQSADAARSAREAGGTRVGVSGTCLLEPAILGALEGVGLSVAFLDSCLGLRSFDFLVGRDAPSEEPNGETMDIPASGESIRARMEGRSGPGAGKAGSGPLESDPFLALARAYLAKPPCPRMFVGTRRAELMLALAREHRAGGIVYIAPKFCDHAYYDFAELKREVGEGGRVPMLLLELEYGSARSGQVITRATAFREMLEGRMANP